MFLAFRNLSKDEARSEEECFERARAAYKNVLKLAGEKKTEKLARKLDNILWPLI